MAAREIQTQVSDSPQTAESEAAHTYHPVDKDLSAYFFETVSQIFLSLLKKVRKTYTEAILYRLRLYLGIYWYKYAYMYVPEMNEKRGQEIKIWKTSRRNIWEALELKNILF